LDQWNDRCTNGFYYGHSGDVPGYGTIAISSADGSRQLAMSVAYPPSPLPTRSYAIALEMTGLAQVALNASCRLQFRWTPTRRQAERRGHLRMTALVWVVVILLEVCLYITCLVWGVWPPP
jgi:hypothetical protein